MSEKILFVDDDPNLLAACQRNFHRRFRIDVAESGEAGLAKIAADGPYAVVIADRQMPRMDGIQFLSLVRQRSSETVRIMLTGNTDLEATVKVVNEANIFRFLNKPCSTETLAKAIDDGLGQYWMITAERELFSQTLNGSIKLLTDMLHSIDPQSFGRAERLQSLMAEVGPALGIQDDWEIRLAAMLSPIGYVTLPPATVLKLRSSRHLTAAEEKLVKMAPDMAARLLTNIPRLEGVARIIRYQQKNYDGTGFPEDVVKGGTIPLGARLMKILHDLFDLEASGSSMIQAIETLASRKGWYDPQLLLVVRRCCVGQMAMAEVPKETRALTLDQLRVGMVLAGNVETQKGLATLGPLARSLSTYPNAETGEGVVILAAGQQLNEILIEKIRNFDRLLEIKEPILVEGLAMPVLEQMAA